MSIELVFTLFFLPPPTYLNSFDQEFALSHKFFEQSLQYQVRIPPARGHWICFPLTLELLGTDAALAAFVPTEGSETPRRHLSLSTKAG